MINKQINKSGLGDLAGSTPEWAGPSVCFFFWRAGVSIERNTSRESEFAQWIKAAGAVLLVLLGLSSQGIEDLAPLQATVPLDLSGVLAQVESELATTKHRVDRWWVGDMHDCHLHLPLQPGVGGQVLDQSAHQQPVSIDSWEMSVSWCPHAGESLSRSRCPRQTMWPYRVFFHRNPALLAGEPRDREAGWREGGTLSSSCCERKARKKQEEEEENEDELIRVAGPNTRPIRIIILEGNAWPILTDTRGEQAGAPNSSRVLASSLYCYQI
ncbi:hypothetical protein RRG08_066234 [Elysia crispata]|uniref:Uncharacterized protein n=1 Tax=Elysia crispata TaxID=231223 RepID=A0AAE1EG53_9GAST|nr:hypothetical protein RRG08_066234 [Elysia crispata]